MEEAPQPTFAQGKKAGRGDGSMGSLLHDFCSQTWMDACSNETIIRDTTPLLFMIFHKNKIKMRLLYWRDGPGDSTGLKRQIPLK
jgi:hypothetical protein